MMESWMEVIPPTPPHLANRFLSQSRGGAWTQEENKAFEEALARFDRESPHRWARVAAAIPGKTEGDVFAHYQELESDVSSIESGVIPFPSYSSGPDPTSTSTFTLDWDDTCCLRDAYGKRSGGRGPDQERKKGVPWTEKEHKYVFNYFLTLPFFFSFFFFFFFFFSVSRIYLKKKKNEKKEKKKKKKLHVLFLLGLKKYGRGDWRNISRNFVTSRTPTQVASHAQKYFIRLNSGVKDKRRSSIHDITTVNLPDDDDPAPSPSLPPALVTVSSSPAPSSTAISDQISMIVDSKRHNEAAGCVLNSSARSNPYAQSSSTFGIDLYGLKLESQDLPREILNDSFVRW